MPEVVSRWQWVLLKYECSARNTNEFTVHVALEFSRSITIAPRLVVIVAWYLALKSGLVVGKPTLREAGGFGVYTQWVAGSVTGVVVGVGVDDGLTDGVVAGVVVGDVAGFAAV